MSSGPPSAHSFSKPFPNLMSEGYLATSPMTNRYNCIAWAAGDDTRWWWPGDRPTDYWPSEIPKRTTIYAFLELFRSLGYEKCADGEHEAGIEKVVIYASENVVTHASRQIPNGNWTSKLGTHIDIEHHTISGLEGPAYGQAVRFLRREFADTEVV